MPSTSSLSELEAELQNVKRPLRPRLEPLDFEFDLLTPIQLSMAPRDRGPWANAFKEILL